MWIKLLGELGYRRVVLVERYVERPVPEPDSRLPVRVTLLGEPEVDEYVAFHPDADASEIRRRLGAGQWCFAVRHDGRLVNVTWAVMGRAWIGYLGRWIDLAPDEAYVYGSYTLPPYRGHNVSGPRVLEETRVLRKAGCRRLLAVVTPEHPFAVRHALKLGWRPAGVMGYVKLGLWRHDFWRLSAATTAYWTGVERDLDRQTHYLDAFLGDLKRRAYVDLIRRWGGSPARRILKTDVFEEAMGSADAFIDDLSAAGGLVVGMDISPAMAARARARHGDACQYVACDVRELPFADGSFDLVVSPSTLDHFPSPSELQPSLRELARVLRAHGRLIISLDNRQNVFDPLLRVAIRLSRVPYYIGRSYRVEELRAELETAGFAVTDTTAIIQHPRLTAVAAIGLANWLAWAPLTRAVRRTLTAAQRLERSRWRYYTGCFVAANAERRPPSGGAGALHRLR